MFKKPKRNIRKRTDEIENGSEDKTDNAEENILQLSNEIKKFKEKKKEKKRQLLSFEEELEEGDGDVFQVKKTSQSKRMVKQMVKERKKKKEKIIEDGVEKINVIELNKISSQPILNGREAEFAKLGSSDEEEEENTKSKFSQDDHMKLLLESGRIPDAAMIHAARKRRQLAREMGEEFIPIDQTKNYESANSRLVRDDDDVSDDEERISMHVNVATMEKESRREAFMSVQDEGEDSDHVDDEWESQQIRKGVTGAQITAVQQETYYQQQFTMHPPVVPIPTMIQPSPPPETMPTPTAPIDPTTLLYTSYDTAEQESLTPQAVANKLSERLSSLKEVHRQHNQDHDRVADDLLNTHSECKRLDADAPALAKRFQFYQELRGYVTDLVECLDEKVPLIENLDVRLMSLWQRQSSELIERRRQDIRDQMEEIAPLLKPGMSSIKYRAEDEARARRAAEREGRRTRRRRMREIKGSSGRHMEGMSSDEEMTNLSTNTYSTMKETIQSDSNHVFEDVVEEFSSIKAICRRFENWRNTDIDSYKEAYVHLCLPRVLGPLIKFQMLLWNPIQDCQEFEKYGWYLSLLGYGLSETETEKSLLVDPDVKLVPLVVEKSILPKLKDFVVNVWDPMSTSQTLRLVGLMSRMFQDYPILNSESKHLKALMNSIGDKMKDAVENDVFIPIYSKQMMDTKGAVYIFFQRQFYSAVKLLRNLLSWHGILNDMWLQDLALNSLLNRYLLSALRICEPIDAAERSQFIVMTFPRWWFQKECSVPQLAMFIEYLRKLSQSLDAGSCIARDAQERIKSLLRTLQATSCSS